MSMRQYDHCLAWVKGRGRPPIAFLDELIDNAKMWSPEISAPNNDPEDVFNRLRPILGPWQSPVHRLAALCECLRCLAGFESSWKWHEGVDRTNATSMRNIMGEETGIFQVSFDSLLLDNAKETGDDLHARQQGALQRREGQPMTARKGGAGNQDQPDEHHPEPNRRLSNG